MNNAYWIESFEYRDWDNPPYDDVIDAAMVYAETRGKAKALFIKHFDLEWVEIAHVAIIAKNVDRYGIDSYGPEYQHLDSVWWALATKFWTPEQMDNYWRWVENWSPELSWAGCQP